MWKTEENEDSDSDCENQNSKENNDSFWKYLGGGILESFANFRSEAMEKKLSDTVLRQVPKGLRAAIMNLNENEDLLPAMFLSGVQVHMF